MKNTMSKLEIRRLRRHQPFGIYVSIATAKSAWPNSLMMIRWSASAVVVAGAFYKKRTSLRATPSGRNSGGAGVQKRGSPTLRGPIVFVFVPVVVLRSRFWTATEGLTNKHIQSRVRTTNEHDMESLTAPSPLSTS